MDALIKFLIEHEKVLSLDVNYIGAYPREVIWAVRHTLTFIGLP